MPSFNPSLKPLVAVLTLASASLITTGCVDLDDDDDDSKGVTYQATATLGTVTAGVGEYTVKVTASDGSDLEGATVTVKPVMDMQNDGSINHGTPASVETGELDENGEFKATGYFLMESGDMGSWFLEVSSNDITQTLPITVNWDEGGRANLFGGDDDQIMSMSGGTTARSYYLFNDGTAEHTGMGMTAVSIYVGARESMMDYNAVSVGETLTGGTQDLPISTVDLKLCVSDCMTMDGDASVMNMVNWKAAEGGLDGLYGATFMATDVESIMIQLTVNDEVKTTVGGANHVELSLTGSADSGHGHGM